MKISRIIPSLTGIALLTVMLGCNDLGAQVASVLPENGGPSLGNGQLNESGDTTSIDPSQIGGGNSSMAQPGANDADGMNGFIDGTMDNGYSEMMENVDEGMGMDGGPGDGSLMNFGEEQEIMQLDDPNGGFEGGGVDPEMTAQMELLEPAVSDGDEGSPGYLESMGAMLEPQMDNFGGEQSLGGFGGGVGGIEKPSNGRGPQKQMPSKRNGNGASKGSSSPTGIPNIRDRPTKSSENTPFGASNNPQKPATVPNSQNPRTGKPTSKPNVPAAGIRMPGKIVNPIYTLINNVAVPVLLQNGTAMSFSSEILQQRALTSQGTVYWVVHSQRLGFIRFQVKRAGGRVSGVGSKFTPTSGPFKSFVVAVEADGAVKYLSSAVDIKWNP